MKIDEYNGAISINDICAGFLELMQEVHFFRELVRKGELPARKYKTQMGVTIKSVGEKDEDDFELTLLSHNAVNGWMQSFSHVVGLLCQDYLFYSEKIDTIKGFYVVSGFSHPLHHNAYDHFVDVVKARDYALGKWKLQPNTYAVSFGNNIIWHIDKYGDEFFNNDFCIQDLNCGIKMHKNDNTPVLSPESICAKMFNRNKPSSLKYSSTVVNFNPRKSK